MTDGKESKRAEAATGCVATLLAVPAALLWAKVYADVWRWFPARMFDLPTFRVIDVAGVLLLLAMLRLKVTVYKNDKEIQPVNTLAASVILALWSWLIGYFFYWMAMR